MDAVSSSGRDERGCHDAANEESTLLVHPDVPRLHIHQSSFASTFKKKEIAVKHTGSRDGGTPMDDGARSDVCSRDSDASDRSSTPVSPVSPSSPAMGKQSLAKKLVSRVKELKELFGLDVDDEHEELLDTFMCALKKRILLQGRMYVFTKHVCFSSSLFGYHKLKTIPMSSLLSVRKMKHVGFPNSVEILWKESEDRVKKEFFTSFLSREEAFRMILGLWDPCFEGGKRATVMSSNESNASDDSAERDHRDHIQSSVSRESLSTGGMEDEYCRRTDSSSGLRNSTNSARSRATSATPSGQNFALDPMLGYVRQDELFSSMDRTQSAGEILTPRGDEGQDTAFHPSRDMENPFRLGAEESAESLEPPPEVPPIMQKVMEYTIPVKPQEFYDLFLSSKSEFFVDYHAAQGHNNIQLSAWDYHGAMGPVRDLSFVTALKGFRIGPPEALCHQTQRVGVYAGSHIVFETSQVMSDIPYGDHFKVETRWDIFPKDDGEGQSTSGSSSSKMIIHIAVPFTKNTMFKKFIEKGVTDSLLEAYQMFKRLATQKLEGSARQDDHTRMGGLSDGCAPGENLARESKPAHPEDLLPQQEEDWEMILERVEPKFRTGLASLRKMQQEVARQNKFSLTKSKHRRNLSVIDSAVLDAIISDCDAETPAEKTKGVNNHVDVTGKDGELVAAKRNHFAPSWPVISMGVDSRDMVYVSLIIVLLAVIVGQACMLARR